MGARVLGAMLGLVAVSAGCAKPSGSAADQAAVDSAIEHLRSGQTVGQVSSDLAPHTLSPMQPESFRGFPAPPRLAPGDAADPCPSVPNPSAGAPEAQWQSALTQLGACMRTALNTASPALGAFDYFKFFTLSTGARPLSTLTDSELVRFLSAGNTTSPSALVGINSPLRAMLRDSFTDADLDELGALAQRRLKALSSAEQGIFAAIDAHRGVVEHYAATNDRYRVLLALRAGSDDQTGQATGQYLVTALQGTGLGVPHDLSQFPVGILHPYAIQVVVPAPGREAQPLDPSHEDPFGVVGQTLADFGGPQALDKELRDAYVDARNHDNPQIPQHAPAAPGAARVAVVDTGIDFVKYPDLALFLGEGAPGGLRSHDYADGDCNPWMLSTGELGHGTGTSATVLTVLAHYAPEVLRARQIETAVWKVESLRSLLAGPFAQYGNWNSRYGIQEALMDQIRSPGIKPDIVSISAIFPLQEFLQQANVAGIVKRAPWLWVMAAGNQGVDVGDDPMPACLSDVPSDQRDDSRILCVGALLQGVVNDRIAGYSNFGNRVDVYAYQSYIDLCPNGTSCATPAVTAAAALIKAKFPRLTPQQIKQVIVQSAEERTLAVDPDGYNGPRTASADANSAQPMLRTVRVFDPATMLSRALENAARL